LAAVTESLQVRGRDHRFEFIESSPQQNLCSLLKAQQQISDTCCAEIFTSRH
jgi:hypothetical protein